jgi:hypothetical protein
MLGFLQEGTENALDRVQTIAAKFAHNINYSKWEILTHCRKIDSICAFFKVYTGEGASNAIDDTIYVKDHDTRVGSIMIGKLGA